MNLQAKGEQVGVSLRGFQDEKDLDFSNNAVTADDGSLIYNQSQNAN